MAQAAHTIVVGASVVSGPQADVMSATYYACEVALRMLKPGKTTTELADMIEKVAAEFGCKAVQGNY